MSRAGGRIPGANMVDMVPDASTAPVRDRRRLRPRRSMDALPVLAAWTGDRASRGEDQAMGQSRVLGLTGRHCARPLFFLGDRESATKGCGVSLGTTTGAASSPASVSGNWRVTFEVDGDEVAELNLEDCH